QSFEVCKMTDLLQRIAAFLYHVIDAPESAPDTRDTAKELVDDVIDKINQPDTKKPEDDQDN
ncbi:MAG: hypothetical protein ABGX16_19845, partial [Pirellulales bacterium]